MKEKRAETNTGGSILKTIRGKIVLSFVAVFTIVFVMYGYTIFSTSYRFIIGNCRRAAKITLVMYKKI